ncbi:mandelate racemase [Chloroflexi bacterium TSY]|nr:mandelate racemase [Chloroflexi bacterium TSY]
MTSNLKINRIIITHFQYDLMDLALEVKYGFDTVYTPGDRFSTGGSILTIETDAGIRGEVPGTIDKRTAQYLLGRNPLQREIIWHDLKRLRRQPDATPPSAVDIALWDIAGKLYEVPVYQLLGGWRKKLPAYASTYHGDENGGLSTPEDYAEFALLCKETYGYPAFKIHGWVHGPIDREVAAVLAIRDSVGDEMDLMLDPAGAFSTFDDVLRVGRACDEARYMWYEDAFRGGGFSQFAHAKLRELIKTPLLMGEHIRGLEAKMDTIHAGATDYVRANAHMDGGITGVMKIAAIAEANGLDVELHGGGLAHRHCMATIRNTNYFELGVGIHKVEQTKAPIYPDRQWMDEVDSVDKNGCVDVPEGAGLGVPLDWDFINAHKTGEAIFE